MKNITGSGIFGHFVRRFLRAWLLVLITFGALASLAGIAQAQTCAPRNVVQGTSFTLAPMPISGTVTKSGTDGGWQPAPNSWYTFGGDYTIQWNFSQPVPASWFQFNLIDVDLQSTNARLTVTLGAGSTATVAQMVKVTGDLVNTAGVIRLGPPARDQNGTFRFNSTGTITSLRITATNIVGNDNIGHQLTVRPACLTVRKISQGGTGTFTVNMANVAQVNGTGVLSTALRTTTAGTPVSSPDYFASRPGTNLTLTEVVPSGWNLASAVCTDQAAASTGNPAVIGTFARPRITIPGANVRPGSAILCTFTNANSTDLAITKSDGSSNYAQGSNTIYNIVVTNRGPAAVTNAVVRDPLPAGITTASWTCGSATGGAVCDAASGTGAISTTADLPVGASVTYRLTMGIPATFTGNLVNTATVAAPAGVTDSNTANNSASDTDVLGDPAMTIDKTGTLNDLDGDGLLDPGETVSYAFLVTNTGGVTLTGVTVNDPKVAVVEAPQTLAPRGSFTFHGTYTPTQAEIDAGQVTNTATGTGTPPSGPPTESPPDTVVVPPDQAPGLTIDKTGTLNDLDGDNLLDPGETVSYAFLVTNTGSVTLTGVTVNDPKVTVVEAPQTLAPRGSFTFHGTYTPSQTEIDAGQVTNTATGTGTPPSGPPTESPPDTVVVPPDQVPGMTIDKTGTLNDLDGDNLLDPGETVSYSFLVRNTGNVTLTGVTVNDPLLVNAGISVTPAPQTLAPGGSATFTAIYTPTQGEIDAGQVTNTATPTGTPPSGPPVEGPPDTVIVPPDQATGLIIDKTGTLNDLDGDNLLDPGETISYSFLVTNTGNVTLTNVTVNDPKVSVVEPAQTLAPGASFTFTGTYTPTQAEIDAGSVSNTATPTGTPPSGPPVEGPPDTVVVPPDQASGLTIDKTGTLNDLDGDNLLDPGETVSYSFLVTNTGNVTLTGVTVNDPLLVNAGIALDQGPQTLIPVASFTFTATYTPTQAQIDAGQVTNTATGTGTPPSGPPVESPPDTVVVPPDQTPGLTIDKTGTLNDLDGDNLLDPGETVSYSFLATNTGSVTLTGVTVNDPLLINAGIAVTPGPQTLAPGGSATFTATYTPTQAEIDAGSVSNTATGTGTPPSGPPTESPPDTVVVPPDLIPGLTIDKTGTLNDLDGDGLLDPGETVSYAFLVTNTGGVTLTGVTVNDPKVAVVEAPQTLAPRGSFTFHGTYTPTQAEIDAGQVTNTATGTGTPPSGPPTESPPDTVVVPPDQAPGLTIDKTGTLNDLDGDNLLDPGETVSYAFLVTNTGSVTLTGVTVNDPKVTVVEAPQTLAPRGSFTFHGTYTPSQTEIDAGQVTNTATGTGTPPSGPPTESPPDTVVVPPDQVPGMTIDKTGTLNDLDGDNLLDPGETVSYSFLVRNTGNVTLTGVTVNDPLLVNAGISVTPAPQTLAPGGSATFTAIYTPTQGEIDAGQVTNTATPTGTPPSGPPVEGPPDTVIVPPDQATGLIIDKTGTLNDLDGDNLLDPGETISYSFLVTNTGNVTLTNVTVNDPKVSVVEPAQTLAPGASFTFTGTYTPTQAEIDAGSVSNTATPTGTPPSGPPVEGPPDTVVVPPDQASGLTIDKTGTLNDLDGDNLLDPGETVSYSFLVTNTGNVTLTGVTVNDPLLVNAGLSVTPAPQTLAPSGSVTFTAVYTPSQADIDAGSVSNTATPTGTPPSGPPVEGPPDTVVVPPDQASGMTIDKTGTLNDQNGNNVIDPGETIGYAFVVRNTGAVTLTNVTVNDPLLQNAGVVLDQGPQTLAPGASFTFTATYAPTQAEIEAGNVSNTATGTGTPPSGPPVESPPDTVVVPPVELSRLTIEKTGTFNDVDRNSYASIGDTLTYTFTVTNTGGQVITGVTPVDAGPTFNGKPATATLSAFTPASVTLAAKASQTFSATYTLTQDDIDNAAGIADGIKNSATAEGVTGGNPVASNTSSTTTTMPAAEPSDISIIKQAGLRQIKRGQKAPFTIKVTNHSSRNAGAVSVTDIIPSGFRFVEGSASVDGVAATPIINGQRVRFDNVVLGPNAEVVIRVQMLALSSAGPGKHTNRATVNGPDGDPLAPEARADVEITIEPVFDCGDIVGKVFDDANENGYQDDGELGLPGVRIATVRGSLITTDKHGRFHVACADLPDSRIGSNYIMKLDPRTLPTGYRVTTENPRVIRLTAGKMSTLNFGASIGRVVRLDLSDAAFERGTTVLRKQWERGLDQLIETLAAEPSTLRIGYGASADSKLARARIKSIEEEITQRWKSVKGRYELNIETRVEAAQ
ncbi:DUF7507 domain-containing protein [Phyllobacterium sp. 22552]|uniref:DUF7507 domain-containing protein n=1 Tax=Phyllobacterium sp. 22552 TaxID=3453941 RepID=UPI003F879820